MKIICKTENSDVVILFKNGRKKFGKIKNYSSQNSLVFFPNQKCSNQSKQGLLLSLNDIAEIDYLQK